MERHVVIVNFKTYPQATGEGAVRLARECEAAGKQYGFDVRIAVQATDIHRVAQAVSIPVYAQHADPVEPDRHTGWTSPHAIKEAGARGSLLNHAERPTGDKEIAATVNILKREGLDAVVICDTTERLRQLDRLVKPAFFSVESPELIGTGVSVSTARPELVKGAVHATRTPLLVGAGVKTHEDLSIALELGAKGVLLASGIVIAPHWGQALKKLLSAHAR